MHVSNVHEVLFALGIDANRILPFMNEGENLCLCRRREHRRSLGKPFDEFVEKFFRRYLKVERIADIFDEVV